MKFKGFHFRKAARVLRPDILHKFAPEDDESLVLPFSGVRSKATGDKGRDEQSTDGGCRAFTDAVQRPMEAPAPHQSANATTCNVMQQPDSAINADDPTPFNKAKD